MTCHNRKRKTLKSLVSLYKSAEIGKIIIDVFLVDDGSTDGTEEDVIKNFPKVKIIKGTGSLYWNGGMRLAWDVASNEKEYDFYFWLNDDSVLHDFAISEFLDCFNETLEVEKKPAVIVGSCQEQNDESIFSYGGRDDNGPVIPNGKLQKCKYINGNAVLISSEIFKVVGNLSGSYTHSMGDFDYGLRAQQHAFNCVITKKYIAVCPSNDIPDWENENIPFGKRWKLLHSPKGLNVTEYNEFRRKYWGKKWIVFAFKAYLKTLFPSLYRKLSNNLKNVSTNMFIYI